MDQYKLSHVLGSGGFGTVYAATARDGTRVAIKVFPRARVPLDAWVYDAELGQIPFEVDVIRKISHPNIIKFINYFQSDDLAYLVTELHPFDDNNQNGMDLFEFIERNGSLSPRDALRIFAQITDALSYLHSLGLVHRDIKDENILINAKLQIKLVDFGSASYFSKDTLFSRFFGTIQYAPPEVLLSRPYAGPQAEIWALGCCLFAMLTGSMPFASAMQAIHDTPILFDNHSFDNHPFDKQNSLQDDCKRLLMALLAKNAHDRITIPQLVKCPLLC